MQLAGEPHPLKAATPPKAAPPRTTPSVPVMVNVCVVCGAREDSETTAKAIVYHRIPPRNQAAKRKKWLEGFQLEENAVTGASRVCNKHSWKGIPCVTLGTKHG